MARSEAALAVISGSGAPEFAATLRPNENMEVGGGDTVLVRARDATLLADALHGLARPKGRVRVEVDPLRI